MSPRDFAPRRHSCRHGKIRPAAAAGADPRQRAADGGTLALVKAGDEVGVGKRLIHLHLSDEEPARRRVAWTHV